MKNRFLPIFMCLMLTITVLVMGGCSWTPQLHQTQTLQPTSSNAPKQKVPQAIIPTKIISLPESQKTDPGKNNPPNPTPTIGDAGDPTPAPTATPLPQPTPTSAPSEPFAGVEIEWKGFTQLVSELGPHWIRMNGLLWYAIEAEQGLINWSEASQLEENLVQVSAAGMETILIVRGVPVWAQQIPDNRCGPISAEFLDDYAAFLTEAVKRYKEPPFNVKYWELGNEPDVDPNQISPDNPFGCWGDARDLEYFGGGYYAQVLKAAYPAIKAVDPAAQVLVGGLLMDCDPVQPPEKSPGSGDLKNCTSSRYLEGILNSGGGLYFDGVSFHAYDYYQGAEGNYSNGNWHSAWNTTGPVLAAKADYIHSLLVSYGFPQKFLINTETALLCGRDGSEPDCHTDIFNKTKAYYIIQSSAMALAEGLKANIWYSMEGWRGSSLVDRSGQTLLVYQAYQFVIQMLSGASYSSAISDVPGIAGYEFKQGEQVIWVVWSIDGNTHQLEIPGSATGFYDSFGNQVSVEGALPVTLAPVYIVWISSQ